MKIVSAVFLLMAINLSMSAQTSVRFAVIGDYGNAGPDEEAVADLVKSYNPDFIITTGDNNYDVGSEFTIDANIGQYYHSYIYPYIGAYGSGALVNKFFPSLGNHDWETPGAIPYLNYFVLPGNERYYDFVKGPVHFFVIDSDVNEYDGRDSNSIQAQWLKNALSQSSSRFNVVYFHHPPYCSGLINGSETIMRWPFKNWGANAVMSGHEHLYERLTVNGLTYFVNGLGGNLRSPFGFPISGSQVRYNGNYGAMIVDAYNDSLILKFYNISNSLRDNFKILPPVKTLNLGALLEGLYNEISNSMVPDTVKVILRDAVSPYPVIDSVKGILNSSGNGLYNFQKAVNSTDYFIIVKHRNSIETWSAAGNRFTVNNLNYNFTLSENKAFGNNLKLKGNRYCIYSGDVNQDGSADAGDISLVENDLYLSLSGYNSSDLNGDYYTDAGDLSIVENNASQNVAAVTP